MDENWKKLELNRELDLSDINKLMNENNLRFKMGILTKIDSRTKILGDQ